MSFTLNAFFSLSIVVGAAIGGLRWRKINAVYLPFLLLTWAGLVNEILSIGLSLRHHSNLLTYNIYSLAESLLIVWQFRRWGLFSKRAATYPLLLVLLTGAWCYESLCYTHLEQVNSYFIIGYSMLVVLLSITLLSQLLYSVPTQLFRDARFLICTGLVLYFTYAVLTETFWLYGLTQAKAFRVGVYAIQAWLNLFTNLLFALAILWMPIKPRYIMRS